MAGAGLVIALSAVWLLAGTGKLAVPQITAAFLTWLTNRLVTIRSVRALAAVEVAISIGLTIPPIRLLSALVSALASVVLLAVLVRATRLPDRVPCGCFGPLVANQRIDANQFVLVALMLLASVLTLAVPAGDRYLGLYAQVLALAAALVLTGTRYLRLRHAA
jgi:hypothetical protein